MINPVSYEISFLTIRETPSHEWNAVHIQLSKENGYKLNVDLLSTHQNKLATQVDLLRYAALTKLPAVNEPMPVVSFFTNENKECFLFQMTPDNQFIACRYPEREDSTDVKSMAQHLALIKNSVYVEPRKEDKSETSPAA